VVVVRPPRAPRRRRRRHGPDDGVVAVFAADEQADLRVDVATWQRLAEQVLIAEGVTGDAELSLLFIDAGAMATLNTNFMDVDGPTDVLAFPIDAGPVDPGRQPDGGTPGPDRDPIGADELPLLLGDVVICPEVAARNAPEHAGTVDDEIALLVVHGVLHVLGMDHAEAADRVAMQERERSHLVEFWRMPTRNPWDALSDPASPDATEVVVDAVAVDSPAVEPTVVRREDES
jgi:probable rRNA maturation factor